MQFSQKGYQHVLQMMTRILIMYFESVQRADPVLTPGSRSSIDRTGR